jgi:hypothetical protein
MQLVDMTSEAIHQQDECQPLNAGQITGLRS